MKFNQFKVLRDKTIDRLKSEQIGTVQELGELSRYDSLSLAYIGDAVYSMYIRKAVILTGIKKVRVIHEVVTKIICAKSQAKAFIEIEPMLTEVEAQVTKRARNSNVNVPKSAEVWEYRNSTALEALFGFLYLNDEMERLEEFCKLAMQVSLK